MPIFRPKHHPPIPVEPIVEQPLSATIIVLNWNGLAHLQLCLPTLLAQTYPNYQVVVVDNASSDGSVAYVRQHFPEVRLQVNAANLGFAAGNNAALRQMTTDVAVLVNNDVTVRPNWLAALLDPFRQEPRIAIVGSKIFYPDGRLQHVGGHIQPPRAIPSHLGWLEQDDGQWEAVQDVAYVSGAAFALRRRVGTTLEWLDEGFFFYFEDADLCFRARAAGFRVVVAPAAIATHFESASIVRRSRAYLRHFHTSRWRFILKHYAPTLFLTETLAAERAWLNEIDSAERQAAAHAYRQTLWHLSAIEETRRQQGSLPLTDAQAWALVQALQTLRQAAWRASLFI